MSNVFCLLGCFSNYEIVASKVIEFYITNALNSLNPGITSNIKTYYSDTPFMLYSLYYLPGENVYIDPSLKIKRSKQLTDFVIILALAAVTLYRISQSDVTIFASQGVVVNPGFATMFTIANQLNKETVYWTDDLRNIWGTTNDPLFIGMAPLPYKYLWTSSQNPLQPDAYNVQTKGLNGSLVIPNLASSKDLCPVVSEEKFKNNWNSFINLINGSKDIKSQVTNGTVNSRISNLISLGEKIVNYVEVDKGKPDSKFKMFGLGWNPGENYTLYFDIESVINNNLKLLLKEEQGFFLFNVDPSNYPADFPADFPFLNNIKNNNPPKYNSMNGKILQSMMSKGLKDLINLDF